MHINPSSNSYPESKNKQLGRGLMKHRSVLLNGDVEDSRRCHDRGALSGTTPPQVSSFGRERVAMRTNKDVSAYRNKYRGFLRFNRFLGCHGSSLLRALDACKVDTHQDPSRDKPLSFFPALRCDLVCFVCMKFGNTESSTV